MEDKELPNKSEQLKNLFSEVSFSYINLYRTNEICGQRVFDEINPLTEPARKKFMEIMERISESQGKSHKENKYTWMGMSDHWIQVQNDRLETAMGLQKLAKANLEYVFWGNSKQEPERYFLPNDWSDNTSILENFKKFSRPGFSKKLTLNLPILENINDWEPFKSVLSQYTYFVDKACDKYIGGEAVRPLVEEYHKLDLEVEKKSLEIEGNQMPLIKNRLSQLISSIKRIPTFPFGLVPKYVRSGNLFLFTKDVSLMKDPSLDLENKSDVKPNIKKLVEADPSDWFNVSRDIQRKLVKNIEKIGWKHPVIEDNKEI